MLNIISDIILYVIFSFLFPEDDKKRSGDWIILDHNYYHDNIDSSDYDSFDKDPYINGEYHDGPDW